MSNDSALVNVWGCAGQHIALHEPPKDDHIGLICTACSPVQVAQDAINDARCAGYAQGAIGAGAINDARCAGCLQ